MWKRALGACALSLSIFTYSPVVAQEATIEDFATRSVMRAPSLSPDGEHVAYRVAQTKNGDYFIEIRDTDNLAKKPVRIGSEVMSISGFNWIGDDYILVNFLQKVRDQVKDTNEGVFDDKRAIVKADGTGRFIEIFDDTTIVSSLPSKPNAVLVRTSKFNRDDVSRLQASGRSIGDIQVRDFYEMNVKTGGLKKVLNANSRFFGYQIDMKGNIRLATEYDAGTRENIYYHRAADRDSQWTELFRNSVDDYADRLEILGFDPQNDNIIFVAATNGEDLASVYEYDLGKKALGEKIFGLSDQDIENALFHPNYAKAGELVGFGYYDEDGKYERVFLDGEMQNLFATLQATFPDNDLFLGRQSRDGKAITFTTQNYDNPGTYYLLNESGLQELGKSRINLDQEKLFRQEYITYESRDGVEIPAYVTFPKGEGPHPLVVMPHGGPWVSYRPARFDEWSQFLASQGYMVIDPLFRGTTGLGTEHWLSSFGEWGKMMSDDMDDGALHLIQEGLVDPDRVAMFGWSFGGYSAFAASVRSPQIYQCTIAGAGVGDPVLFRAAFSGNRFLRPQLEKGYVGLDTIEMAADQASVPVLVIHGDLDQRVRIFHSEKFVAEMKNKNKPHKFVVLEGADHFDNTLNYEHRKLMYTEMATFLENDCGPGGL
ncbi:MAG: prolyl oligopeptidase family serine peptidase [Pseudomonadota bacterium]